MDKLFDLMVMGAKYCLLCSTALEDMIQVGWCPPTARCVMKRPTTAHDEHRAKDLHGAPTNQQSAAPTADLTTGHTAAPEVSEQHHPGSCSCMQPALRS